MRTFVLMNLLLSMGGMITVPESFHGYEILMKAVKLKSKRLKNTEVFVSLPPLSYSTFKEGEKKNQGFEDGVLYLKMN